MRGQRVTDIIIDEEMSESDKADVLLDLAQVYKSISQAYKDACEEQKRLYEARSIAIESLVMHTGSQKLEIDGKKIYAVKRQGMWYVKGESESEGFVSVG